MSYPSLLYFLYLLLLHLFILLPYFPGKFFCTPPSPFPSKFLFLPFPFSTSFTLSTHSLTLKHTGNGSPIPVLNYESFVTCGPLFVFDCTHQNESIKTGTVDVKIDIECWQNIQSNTSAYCLIIHYSL